MFFRYCLLLRGSSSGSLIKGCRLEEILFFHLLTVCVVPLPWLIPRKFHIQIAECTTSLSGKLKIRLCFLSCCKQIVDFLVRSLVYASVVIVDNKKQIC